ncbi:alpha-L-rhamnosidase-related protein [Flavobacterium branchiophilum]|nr:glycogen debranching protein [Flavobacterium branchiophilum]
MKTLKNGINMLQKKQFRVFIFLFFITYMVVAQHGNVHLFRSFFEQSEGIKGQSKNLSTPFNTAGNKLYMIGHQDGTFPDMGWHIPGEMGGIWHHPIKLMDGFEVAIALNGSTIKLDKAHSFINFPFGNQQLYTPVSDVIEVERLQFVPDNMNGICIYFYIKNKSKQVINIKFEMTNQVNLRPVWLGERTKMIDSEDISTFDERQQYWISKDQNNPWYVVCGSTLLAVSHHVLGSKPNKPNTSIIKSVYEIQIQPQEMFEVPYFIAGSSTVLSEATQTYKTISSTTNQLLIAKKNRVLSLDHYSTLTIDDKALENTFRWLKYASDWLTQEVSGVGRGIVAGLADYPWWFGGDLSYTLKGLIRMGQKDLVYSSIDLISNISDKNNGNGRIVHEVSTNGAVYNLGNVCETPQFVSLIWDVYCWTGDEAFLKKFFPKVTSGLTWLMQENDFDKNGLPDGNGMMEIHGLNSEMIDVAAYSQKAFDDASKMALVLNNENLSKKYKKQADYLKNKINNDFWVANFNSYADFIGTKQEALHLAKDAIVRADTLQNDWAVKELQQSQSIIENETSNQKKGFVLFHNWVVNTPMETGIASYNNAIKALNTASAYTNQYGMYVTGIDKNKLSESENTINRKSFTYTGTVMTLPTGVQIIAENNYGRQDKAYELMKKVVKTFSYALPGSMYEASPDYGMMTQAWNVYAFGTPIVSQFFGIQPLSYKKFVSISPQLPSVWQHGALEHICMGQNEIDIRFEKHLNRQTFKIIQKKKDWTIHFEQPAGNYKIWILNGKNVKPIKKGTKEYILLKGNNTKTINLYFN